MSGPVTRVPFQDAPAPVANGAGMTHRGQVRKVNEDAILTDPNGYLWAISDGMGGYGHGDVASDIVIEALSNLPDRTEPAAALRHSIEAANAQVFRHAAENGIQQMGATCVAALILDGRAHLAWVGDSRAYLFRNGRLQRLSRDHSVVQNLIDSGDLAEEEAEKHPERHVVTRAVGVAAEVEPSSLDCPLAAGDRLLLCSDGLTCCVSERLIEAHVGAGKQPDLTCHALLTETMIQGAPDNVSVIVIDIEDA